MKTLQFLVKGIILLTLLFSIVWAFLDTSNNNGLWVQDNMSLESVSCQIVEGN